MRWSSGLNVARAKKPGAFGALSEQEGGVEPEKSPFGREVTVELEEHSGPRVTKANRVIRALVSAKAETFDFARPGRELVVTYEDVDIGHGTRARAFVKRGRESRALQEGNRSSATHGQAVDLFDMMEPHDVSRELHVKSSL